MLYETIRLALSAILRNTLRSFLTVLGIVIGVAAVIAMLTIGQATTAAVTSEVGKLGTRLILVIPGNIAGGHGGGAMMLATKFTLRDVAAIRNDIAGVDVAAPLLSRTETTVYGSEHYTTMAVGTTNDFLAARGLGVVAGRPFNESELRSGANVCILGRTPREKLFGRLDPIGAQIRVKQISCLVIGVLESKGASTIGRDQDDLILMPLKTVHSRLSGNQDVDTIYVGVREGLSTDKVKTDIEALLRERRKITPGEDDDFSVADMKELGSMMTQITTILTGLLSALAAISLLVGGIGIMNIMLVSVTERTREIGIRLAIGAASSQVLTQFLVEAVVLSLIGGLIGVALGLSLAAVGTHFLAIPFVIDPAVIALAFVFSAIVGIIFGYFPARRAARMDPIDALRHE